MPREGDGEVGRNILSTVLVATTRVLTGRPKLAMCFSVNALIGCTVVTWLLGTYNNNKALLRSKD